MILERIFQRVESVIDNQIPFWKKEKPFT